MRVFCSTKMEQEQEQEQDNAPFYMTSSTISAPTTEPPQIKIECAAVVTHNTPDGHAPAPSEQQLRWMVASDAHPLRVLESEALAYPIRCVIVGTNGTLSFALQCADDTHDANGVAFDALPAQEPIDLRPRSRIEEWARLEPWYVEYAKRNVAFAYKRLLSHYEAQTCFAAHLRYSIGALQSDLDAKRLSMRVTDIAGVDVALRPVVKQYGKLLSDRIKQLVRSSNSSSSDHHMMPEQRPGNIATLHADSTTFIPVVKQPATSTATTFRLLICKTPALKAGNAAPKRKAQWRDRGYLFKTAYKTVPAAACSATHLLVVYQAARSADPSVVWLELYALQPATGTLQPRQWRRALHFPPQFSTRGMLGVSLSDSGVACICFSRGVLVFDINSLPLSAVNTFWLAKKRQVTCARVCGGGGATLVIGSDMGECYCVADWRAWNGEPRVDVLPAAEPILSAHYDDANALITLHSVMAVATIGETRNRIIPMDRPMAMDRRGNLLFVMTKYGQCTVYDVHTEQVARNMPRPKGGAQTPLLQFAYAGVRAFDDHLVCLMPSGMVRRFDI